ncbi:MAG: G5 domain-containing protein [Clostridia bacterium]|nr:G5 domain-containing protein [Clostridia bacterium]
MIKNFEPDAKSNLKKAVSLVLVASVCTASVFSLGNLSRKVNVDVDGEKLSTLTLNEDTDKILSQVGVETEPNDVVTREDENNEININVKKSFNVYVKHGDDVVTVEMAEGTVKDALDKSDLELSCDEGVNFSLDDRIFPNMNIVVSPLIMVTVNVRGEAGQYFVPQCTVMDALNYLNIDISSEDILNVDALADIYDGMEINLNKVEYIEETVEEEVPFNTVYKKSDLISDDHQKITTPGKKGLNQVTYRKVIVDGKEVSKEAIKTVVISEPVDEVVVTNGNYQEDKPKEEPQKPTPATPQPKQPEGKTFVGSATAYTAAAGSRTATGTIPRQGVTVAVNPKKIPYGSRIKVTTLSGSLIGIYTAEDTGGALNSGSALVDIFMNSRMACLNFGRQQVKVTIL